MSRAFTKEDSWEEPIVPPRVPLPEGVPNYVTPRGKRLLEEEQAALQAERASLEGEGDDELARKRRFVLARRLAELAARIASAEVVDPAARAHDRVRFGTRVTLRDPVEGETREFRIVGVDEADPEHGLIAFTAPVAKAVLGKAVGDEVMLPPWPGERLIVAEIDDTV